MQIKEKKRKAQKAKLCVKRGRRSAKGEEEAQKINQNQYQSSSVMSSWNPSSMSFSWQNQANSKSDIHCAWCQQDNQ
jgi:hypothetical protein